MPNRRLLGLLIVVLVAAGCAAAGPVSSPSPVATVAATTTPAPTVAATPQPSPESTPIIYAEVEKTSEGGHGGPRPLDLPASFMVDYTATGTCEFTIQITIVVPDQGKSVAGLAISVTGTTVSGSWPVNIPAGSYYVAPGEAVGCTFHLVAHAPD
jgi:hypothetical protein